MILLKKKKNATDFWLLRTGGQHCRRFRLRDPTAGAHLDGTRVLRDVPGMARRWLFLL